MEHVTPILARMVYTALYHVNSTKVLKIYLKQTPALTQLFFTEYTREIARHAAYLERNEGVSSVGYFTTPDNREVSYKAHMHASLDANSTGLSHNTGDLSEKGSASAERKDTSRQQLDAPSASELRERQQLKDQIHEEEALRLQFEALRRARFESEARARDARIADMRLQIAEEQNLVESGRSGQHSTFSASPFQGRNVTQGNSFSHAAPFKPVGLFKPPPIYQPVGLSWPAASPHVGPLFQEANPISTPSQNVTRSSVGERLGKPDEKGQKLNQQVYKQLSDLLSNSTAWINNFTDKLLYRSQLHNNVQSLDMSAVCTLLDSA